MMENILKELNFRILTGEIAREKISELTDLYLSQFSPKKRAELLGIRGDWEEYFGKVLEQFLPQRLSIFITNLEGNIVGLALAGDLGKRKYVETKNASIKEYENMMNKILDPLIKEIPADGFIAHVEVLISNGEYRKEIMKFLSLEVKALAYRKQGFRYLGSFLLSSLSVKQIMEKKIHNFTLLNGVDIERSQASFLPNLSELGNEKSFVYFMTDLEVEQLNSVGLNYDIRSRL